MAKLAIEGMEFHAYHGYYEEEQLAGGRYTVDVYVHLPSEAAVESDRLTDTVNYEDIHRITEGVMQEPVRLIEHLAGRILAAIKTELRIERKVKIRVRKHHPPLKGVAGQAWVEVSG